MKLASFSLVLCLATMGIVSGSAFAVTSSASFGVTATVVSSCRAALPLVADGADVRKGASSVAVTCTLPTSYSINTRAAVASETAAMMPRLAGNGRSSPQIFPTAGERELPADEHPNAIIVTVAY
jgi:hypothetical protein